MAPKFSSLDEYVGLVSDSDNFTNFIRNIIVSVYDDIDELITIATSERFITIWKSAFSEKGNGGEIMGDKLYATAIIKLLYARSKGNVTPKELSNMNIKFTSVDFINLIVETFGFNKWSKVDNNNLVFKRFVATLANISQSIHDEFLKSKKYELATNTPTEFIAVERLVDTILASLKVDLKNAAKSSDKTFLTQIPDLFGFKGKWNITHNGDRTLFTFNIYDKDLVNKLAYLVNTDQNKVKDVLNGLSGTKDVNEMNLINMVVSKIEQVGITRQWVENYRNMNRIETIQPEGTRSLFINTLNRLGYDSALFDYSESHSYEYKGIKIGVVILNGINKEGDKIVLHTETGEIYNENYIPLKNRCVESWIKSSSPTLSPKRVTPSKSSKEPIYNFPFNDDFQKSIERYNFEFLNKRYYGGSLNPNRSLFFDDIKILERKAKEASEGKLLGYRLIWIEIKSNDTGSKFSVDSFPKEESERFISRGDERVRSGLVKPLYDTLEWARSNNLEVPKNMNIKIFFWVADKPSWDDEINNLPVFSTSAIPGQINFLLFPDVSYFAYTPYAKYMGQTFNWDETKKLFLDKSGSILKKDIVYFRGSNTTKDQSNIRVNISKNLKKYIPEEKIDVIVTNVHKDDNFKPLHEEGSDKKWLLDLPGKFPWSVRFKYLFLFKGNPNIIKVNERWEASDGSWSDTDIPWKQWIDTFLPPDAYISTTHNHVVLYKDPQDDMAMKRLVSKTNNDYLLKTLDSIKNIVENDKRAVNPKIGHEIVKELSMDRIYQSIFRIILIYNNLFHGVD